MGFRRSCYISSGASRYCAVVGAGCCKNGKSRVPKKTYLHGDLGIVGCYGGAVAGGEEVLLFELGG